MAVEGTAGLVFLAARLLFGLVLVYMGLNHFRQTEQLSGYAESKGVPASTVAVVASGVMLVLGGLGVAAGAYPVLAAGMLAAFFVVVTPVVHDFWTREGQEAQTELQQFEKNVGLLGASLAFLALGSQEWAYALGLGVF